MQKRCFGWAFAFTRCPTVASGEHDGRRFADYHAEQMQRDPAYREAYEAQEQQFLIAQALIQARSEANMAQEAVAKKMGVPLAAVIPLESGKDVSFRGMARYATATGRPITLTILPER